MENLINNVYHEPNLETMKRMQDNSIDAIVTDPPYGLAFMGKKWDYDVPSIEIWQECLRVLKPGGHLLAFAGTRTQHRMAVRIEDAGFEIRDMIMWVYGCLSDDTEILTEHGWERYSIFRQSSIFTEQKILIYDVQNDLYKWEKPERWNEYRVEQDTAFRIQSDNTDQIVSRNHRCLVERGGKLTFVEAEKLAGVEQMPILRDDFFSISETHKQVLQQDVSRQNGNGSDIDGQQIRPYRNEISRLWTAWRKKPSMERGCNLFRPQREICKSINQVCSMPSGVYSDGAKGRVCNGTSAKGGTTNWSLPNTAGVRASHQPQCNGQQAGEFDAVCHECGSQKVRTRASYQTTLATVTPIEYSGVIFCPTVSTGAFVARRNGMVFITGNSGFPKSHDISKAIDKAAGAEREVVGANPTFRKMQENASNYNLQRNEFITAPATPEAQQWDGWGTALKPSVEPITVARKPLQGTVAENVLMWGTGGINIDGCRVGTEGARNNGSKPRKDGYQKNEIYGKRLPTERIDYGKGRFPANLIHDGSEEAVGMFPETASGTGSIRKKAKGLFGLGGDGEHNIEYGDSGSAARFFYQAKADKGERGQGNTHPTVKPIDLMRYLCRLVTPPGGIVYDPFTGSGTTLIAAHKEGFNWIGSEMTKEYWDIAVQRIKEHTAQQKLF
jgi:site-specific DNA-methyltransferase (adenine-specific)